MNVSINAWLQYKIDEYKFAVRDITVDFYLAQAKLNRPDCSLDQLRNFNDTCLDMAVRKVIFMRLASCTTDCCTRSTINSANGCSACRPASWRDTL